ncbi:hypothetical protein [Rhodopirellula bahusiensis]|uniref:hypothetical protein n=1 Tax=Rhodopirellula bahusiensis TaxID=2014065 RepID=UPI0013047BE9|nr:hypothetical protein [Rhodopirellula bahusiensis]
MHTIHRITASIALSAGTLVAGCSSGFETSGIVLDGDGKPLAKAVVTLFDGISPDFGFSTPVSDDGTFTAGISTAPGIERFRMVTSCDGYHDDERIVYSDDNASHRIVLSRLPAQKDVELNSVGIQVLLDEDSVRFVPDTTAGG